MPPRAPPSHGTIFDVYVRLWVLTEGMLSYRQPFLVPEGWPIAAQQVLFACAALWPTKLAFGLAIFMRVAMFLVQAPMIWDSSIWANFADIAVLGALLVCPRERVISTCSDLIRTQFGFFYIAAGWWKINSAFLDVKVSCASVYVASTLAHLPDALPPPLLDVAPELLALPVGLGGHLAHRLGRRLLALA